MDRDRLVAQQRGELVVRRGAAQPPKIVGTHRVVEVAIKRHGWRLRADDLKARPETRTRIRRSLIHPKECDCDPDPRDRTHLPSLITHLKFFILNGAEMPLRPAAPYWIFRRNCRSV